MADQAASATPMKGGTTKGGGQNPDLRTDNVRLEGANTRQKRLPDYWPVGAALVLVLMLIGAALFTSGRLKPEEAEAAPVSSEPVGVPTGSWGEVLQMQCDPNLGPRLKHMNENMATKRGFVIPDAALEEHALNETKSGQPERYVWTADRPLNGWWNTNWDSLPTRLLPNRSFQVGDRFLVMEVSILAKHGVDVSQIPITAIVEMECGQSVIIARAGCTNHVWPGKVELFRRKIILICPVKGSNPFPNWIADHHASLTVPGNTTGYKEPGHAEEIYEEQHDEPIGGLDNTDYGTPGDGAGGVTPPAAPTKQPDGTVIWTPPTSEPLDDIPPPLAEVPPGGVVEKPTG